MRTGCGRRAAAAPRQSPAGALRAASREAPTRSKNAHGRVRAAAPAERDRAKDGGRQKCVSATPTALIELVPPLPGQTGTAVGPGPPFPVREQIQEKWKP